MNIFRAIGTGTTLEDQTGRQQSRGKICIAKKMRDASTLDRLFFARESGKKINNSGQVLSSASVRVTLGYAPLRAGPPRHTYAWRAYVHTHEREQLCNAICVRTAVARAQTGVNLCNMCELELRIYHAKLVMVTFTASGRSSCLEVPRSIASSRSCLERKTFESGSVVKFAKGVQ